MSYNYAALLGGWDTSKGLTPDETTSIVDVLMNRKAAIEHNYDRGTITGAVTAARAMDNAIALANWPQIKRLREQNKRISEASGPGFLWGYRAAREIARKGFPGTAERSAYNNARKTWRDANLLQMTRDAYAVRDLMQDPAHPYIGYLSTFQNPYTQASLPGRYRRLPYRYRNTPDLGNITVMPAPKSRRVTPVVMAPAPAAATPVVMAPPAAAPTSAPVIDLTAMV